jgi:hypothetical protein
MSEYIKKKQPDEYDDNVEEIFNLIAYHRGKPEVMGSANLKSQMYSADFDLFEKVYENKNINQAKKDIYLNFRDILNHIAKLKNVFFIDFKAGIDEDLYLDKSEFNNPSKVKLFYENAYKSGLITKEQYDKIVESSKDQDELYENARKLWTIRWNNKELDKGYKVLSKGRKKTFIDAVDDKTIIKIDVVSLINGKFVEFSNIYEIYNKGKVVNLALTNIIESVKEDIRIYHKKKMWLKMLKRIFVIARLRKDTKLIETLTQLFNSNVGLLYKIRADFGTLALILEKGYRPIKDIHNNIQSLKAQLSNVYQFPIGGEKLYNDILNIIEHSSIIKNPDEIRKGLEWLDETLLKIVNKQALDFINKHKIPYKQYLTK